MLAVAEMATGVHHKLSIYVPGSSRHQCEKEAKLQRTYCSGVDGSDALHGTCHTYHIVYYA